MEERSSSVSRVAIYLSYGLRRRYFSGIGRLAYDYKKNPGANVPDNLLLAQLQMQLCSDMIAV